MRTLGTARRPEAAGKFLSRCDRPHRAGEGGESGPCGDMAFTRKQNCATHAAGTPSDRQSDLAFQNLLFEAWPLARSPQLGDMRDAVA